MKNDLLINSTIIGISILVALVLSEVALRIVMEDKSATQFTEPSVVGQRMIGGDRDERGWRNGKNYDSAEIVAIGDSQTEGLNAKREEAWPQVLEDITGSTTYQMAHGGSGVAHYFYIVDEAIEKNPNLIIMGIYLGNDLYDTFELVYTQDYFKDYRDPVTENIASQYMLNSLSYELYQTLKTGASTEERQNPILKTRLWLRQNLRLYEVLGNASRSLRENLGLAKNDSQKQEGVKQLAKDNPEQAFYFDAEPEIKTVLSPSYRLSAVDINEVPAIEGLRLTDKFLAETKEKLDAKGIEFLVVIIPTKEYVYKTYFDKQGFGYSEELQNIVFLEAEATNSLFRICDNLDISCYSVLEDLSASLENGKKIYSETINGHPTADGYSVITDSLYSLLSSK